MSDALFDMNFLSEEEKQEVQASSTTISSVAHTVIGERRRSLDFTIGNIQPNENIHFATAAEWNMADLLLYLLEQTGPAEVMLSTFEMSEQPARIISQLIDMKMITKFVCIIDYRSKERKPGVFQLMNNIASKIKQAPCHAKVTLISNKDWQVCVVGSANYTRNIRIEAGIISTDPKVSALHHRWMMNVLNNKNVFGDGSERGTVEED